MTTQLARVAVHLRDKILRGKLVSGRRITEFDIARKLGVGAGLTAEKERQS